MELAFKAEVVTGGELDLFTDLGLPLSDEALEVAHGGVGTDDDAALGVFSIDDIGAGSALYLSDEMEWDAFTLGRVDEELADFFRCVAVVFW